MIKEGLLYKILSAIHFVFYTSILCFGMTFLSLGVLLIPSLIAAFYIGRDYLYDTLNINDSIIKTYCSYFKQGWKAIRYIYITLLMLLNILGMTVAMRMNFLFAIICMVNVVLLLVIQLYIAGYVVFVAASPSMTEVVVSMLYKPQFLITVYLVMLLTVFTANLVTFTVLFFTGTFFLFVLELLIFIQFLYFKKERSLLEDDEKFMYLLGKLQRK